MNNLLKSTVLCIVLLLFGLQVNAQEVSVSVDASTTGNAVQVYNIAGYKVNITDTFFDVKNTPAYFNDYTSIAYSGEGKLIATMNATNAQISDFKGNTLSNIKGLNVEADDPSAKVYILPDASLIVRYDIAFFDFYDPNGSLKYKVSNNTNAGGGEAISELIKDEFGKTILVYNPKIFNEGAPGSMINRVKADGSRSLVFSSRDRFIKHVDLSPEGQFVAVVTARDGRNDRAIVMDKFGNRLNEIESEEELIQANISVGQTHVTLYSEGRMMVYEIASGERVGSSSVRGVPLLFADYFPEDNILIGVAGKVNEQPGLLENMELKVVDFNKRQIETVAFDEPVSLTPLLKWELNRKSSNRYQLRGLNKTLNITTRF